MKQKRINGLLSQGIGIPINGVVSGIASRGKEGRGKTFDLSKAVGIHVDGLLAG
ncbi:MAG: hypothetical protein RML10_03025 [Geminocystis sp.]|nr:hypothetical protein [Geminocystis sp.]MDW8462562.1 hypothetical protein [Geminocystis sp.]HIK36424.1 hypothetical protein [Geminocystis sp. M7585_C2015_104]